MAQFIEKIIVIVADHGPAVSGAHNTIVTARAGKDLISCLVSGLLTIGDRFGGAINGAAVEFYDACLHDISPDAFVAKMKREGKYIPGIGHRVKSLRNPDMRVKLLVDFAKENFPSTRTLDYALEVEQVTTQKKENLILNVDGAIAACMVDLLCHCGIFEKDEGRKYIEIGCLNGLFVLGRTIGLLGHAIDQKRLDANLYRHETSDILYDFSL
jgi:ATP citrate (pro-S)-lyase